MSVKRVLCGLLAWSMLFTFAGGTAARSETPEARIIIEGEALQGMVMSTAENVQVQVLENSGAGGGNYVTVKTDGQAPFPEEGLAVGYPFETTQPGVYQISIVCSQLGIDSLSPYAVKIDGEILGTDYINVNPSVISETGQEALDYMLPYRLSISKVLEPGSHMLYIKLTEARKAAVDTGNPRGWLNFDRAVLEKVSDTVPEKAYIIKGVDSHTAELGSGGLEDAGEIPSVLTLKTKPEIAFEPLTVTYDFEAEEGGDYRLTLKASQHSAPLYLSSYGVSVNGGPYIPITEENAGSSAEPNGGWSATSGMVGVYKTDLTYRLNKGHNQVSFRVLSKRQSDNRGWAYLEEFQFTPGDILSYIQCGPELRLAKGTRRQTQMQYTNQYGIPFIPEGAAVSYQSSEESVAVVSGDGMITAVSPGTAVVTVSARYQNSVKTDTLRVRVYEDREPEVTADAPLHIFTEDQEVSFQVSGGLERQYRITDYFGNVSASGSSVAGQIRLENPKPGHYSLKVEGREKEVLFSVVKAEEKRRNNEASPFASDCASLFLIPEDKVNDYARAVSLAGIRWIRDRARWGVINPVQGSYNYGEHDKFYNAFAQYGINILSVFHSAPAYVRKETPVLPDDLLSAYEYARQTALHYDGTVQAWEVWNEPDIGFTDDREPADKYAALLKAMAIGYKDSGAEVQVSLSGIAYEPGAYVNQLMQNEVGRYFDLYNYHVHRSEKTGSPVSPYPGNSITHNQLIAQYGLGEKPVWVSEAGMFIEYEPGTEELTLEQQKSSARYLAASAVTGLANGEDKHFWFILPYYAENNRSLGSFSKDHMPYASYNAAAAVSDALGNGVYAGRLKGLPPEINGYVFRDGTQSVAALWAEQETAISLITNQDSALLTDIMGNDREAACSEGVLSLTIGPDIQFVRIAGTFPAQAVEPAAQTVKKDKADPLAPNEKVVLSQTYPVQTRTDAKLQGYRLNKSGRTPVSVEVFNFNNQTLQAQITGTAYGGWQVSPPVQNVSVPPMGKQTLTFYITSDGTPTNESSCPVVFGGTVLGGALSSSVTQVISDETEDIQPALAIPGYLQARQWKKNAPLGTVQTFAADGEAITFRYDFSKVPGDKWTYPTLTFSGIQDFSGYDGVAVKVYCDENTAGSTFRLFLTESSGAAYYTSVGYKLSAGWQQLRIPWSAFTLQSGMDHNLQLDTDQITGVRAGLNTTSTKPLSISLKEFGVYQNSAPDCHGAFLSLDYADGAVRGRLNSAEIPYREDTAAVVIDGKEYPAELRDGVFTAQVFLTAGSHEILAKVTDQSGFAIKKRISVSPMVSGVTGEAIFFTDTEGTPIYTCRFQTRLQARVKMKNEKNTENTLCFYAAAYDASGRLTGVGAARETLNPGEERELAVAVDKNGATTVKAFLWDTGLGVVSDMAYMD